MADHRGNVCFLRQGRSLYCQEVSGWLTHDDLISNICCVDISQTMKSAHELSKCFKKAVIEGSLEVKLPTLWTDEKQRWEESEKSREEERRSKRESLRRKKIQAREKVGMSRNTAFFQ